MTEPHPDHPGSDPGSDPDALDAEAAADQVSVALAELSELTAAGIDVDGEAQVAESTWVIYGHTSYDGEIVVGEYHDAEEASEVLRATQALRNPPTTKGSS